MIFAQAIGSLTIAPGNIVTYRIRWDQRNQQGRRVRLGAYEARVVFLGRRAPGAGPVVLSPLEFAVR
jgi:intracellular proteinase inhibitor BsuPI